MSSNFEINNVNDLNLLLSKSPEEKNRINLIVLKCDSFPEFENADFSSFNNLNEFICEDKRANKLPILPMSLKTLRCGLNNLTSLPPLPSSLRILECANNKLTSLPTLPNNLIGLSCSYNPSLTLPIRLPGNLNYLYCREINHVNLLELPPNLKTYDTDFNGLKNPPVYSELRNEYLRVYDSLNPPYTLTPDKVMKLNSLASIRSTKNSSLVGGDIDYKSKYLKYKQKYLELKKNM